MKVIAATAVVALVVASGALSAFQTADPGRFSGTWTLDAAASTNPDGAADAGTLPPSPRPGTGLTGGAGDSSIVAAAGGGSASPAPGGSGPAPGTLDAVARARFYRMLATLTHAPVTLVLSVGDTDVTITPDHGQPLHLVADGKKQVAPAGVEGDGNLENKTKRDGASLKREIKTSDGLTVTETYTVNADGTQLTVSVEAKSALERLSDAQRRAIKRVYRRHEAPVAQPGAARPVTYSGSTPLQRSPGTAAGCCRAPCTV